MLQTMNNNTTSTTTIACHNIFNDLVNGEYIYRNTLAALNGAINIITKGILSNINCDYCCPGCGGIYYFGRAATFTEAFVPSGVFTENDLTPSGKLECCINYAGFAPAEEVFGFMQIPDVENPGLYIPVGYELCTTGNFNSCLQQLQNILGTSLYNDLLSESEGGIVEYSTINGSSMLCNLISQIQLSPVYTPQLLYDFLVRLFDQHAAIVISCNIQNTLGTVGPNIVGAPFDKWSIFTGFGGFATPGSPIPQ